MDRFLLFFLFITTLYSGALSAAGKSCAVAASSQSRLSRYSRPLQDTVRALRLEPNSETLVAPVGQGLNATVDLWARSDQRGELFIFARKSYESEVVADGDVALLRELLDLQYRRELGSFRVPVVYRLRGQVLDFQYIEGENVSRVAHRDLSRGPAVLERYQRALKDLKLLWSRLARETALDMAPMGESFETLPTRHRQYGDLSRHRFQPSFAEQAGREVRYSLDLLKIENVVEEKATGHFYIVDPL